MAVCDASDSSSSRFVIKESQLSKGVSWFKFWDFNEPLQIF